MKDQQKRSSGGGEPPAKLEVYIIGRYYRMEGESLGKGNFARVELGFHTLIKKQVAVKIIDMSQVNESYVRRNLEREARILARLDHPNIVLLYETLKSRELYFIVTELASGGDLCRYIKSQREGKLSEMETRRLARQLVSALHHMHYQGIVHRDLKMENIMMDSAKSMIKLVDFGLSNTWTPESPLTTHCGSPEYAAPELFEADRTYGPEIDIWSLGVILYAMVAGRLPFISSRDENISTRERRKRLLEVISRGLVSTHRRTITATSAEYQSLVCRLLSPDPSQRCPINEIVVNPWITTGGRCPLMLYKRTDPPLADHTSVVHKMSDMLQKPVADIEATIKESPFGPLGGIYNVMTHARRVRRPYTLQEPCSRSPTASPTLIKSPSPTPKSVKDPTSYNIRRAVSSVTQKPSCSQPQNNKVTTSVPVIPDVVKKTLNGNSSSKSGGMSAATSTLNLLSSKSSRRDKLSVTTSVQRYSNTNTKTSSDSRTTDNSTSSTYSSSLQASRYPSISHDKTVRCNTAQERRRSYGNTCCKPSELKMAALNPKVSDHPIKDDFSNRRCKTAPATRVPAVNGHDSSRMSTPTASNSNSHCLPSVQRHLCRQRRKKSVVDQVTPLINTFEDQPQKARDTMRALRKYIGQSSLANAVPPSDANMTPNNSFIPKCHGNLEKGSAPKAQRWKEGQPTELAGHSRSSKWRHMPKTATSKTKTGGTVQCKLKEDILTPSSESTLLEWPNSPVKCANTNGSDDQKTEDPIRRLDQLLERVGFSVNAEGGPCQGKNWSCERKASSGSKSYTCKTAHSRETVAPAESPSRINSHSGRTNSKSKWTTQNSESLRAASAGVRLVRSGHK